MSIRAPLIHALLILFIITRFILNKFRATDSGGRFYLVFSGTVKIPEDVATAKAV